MGQYTQIVRLFSVASSLDGEPDDHRVEFLFFQSQINYTYEHRMERLGLTGGCSLIAIVLLIASVATAQTDTTASAVSEPCSRPTVFSTIHNDGIRGLHTMGKVLAAPTRWQGADLLVAGGIAGGTALCYSLDDKAYKLMERNHSTFNDDATKITVEYGSGYFAVGVPATLYLSGLLLKDTWIRETAVVVGSTVLLTSAITTVGKIMIGRARPYTGFGRATFKPFKATDDYMSFPSGHTTAAFALSASLAARIKNPWATAGLYGLAAAAATSRLYTRDHWLSDVVFSAAYSTAVAHSIAKCYENDESKNEGGSSLQVIPTEGGVRVVWQF